MPSIGSLGASFVLADAPFPDLLIQAYIHNENQLVALSDSSWEDFTDIGRITGSYIIFYQGVPIDHRPHVPVPVAQ